LILHFARWYVLFAAVGSEPSSDEILTKLADSNIGRQGIAYSGLREYTLRNLRVAKEATLLARVAYVPREGKHFTILEGSGSPMLTRIIEKLLVYEADESRPTNSSNHGIDPVNYQAHLRGTEYKNGRHCYVMELTPKHNSKYLIKGTLWIDRGTYGIVRLDGRTSSSVSMFLGATRISEEFGEVEGLWLPSHMRAVSSSFLVGTSELEIRYTDYRITDIDNTVGDQHLVAQPK